MTARDMDGWLPYIDAYVDGTLGEKDALRLTVAAAKSDELKAEIGRVRAFHAALSAMPVASPARSFDDRILQSVPLGRYASAPRRNRIAVALGELAPTPVQRLVERLGGALSAVALAWLLAVVLGSTAWQGKVSTAGAWISGRLQALSDATVGSAVIGPVAAMAADAYDAAFGALGSLAGTVGLGLTIFALGAAIGVVAIGIAVRGRSAVRGRRAHHA